MRKGFSLIELLISMSLVIGLFTLGYAGFRESQRRQSVDDAVRKFIADMRVVQGKALSGTKPTGSSSACGDIDNRSENLTAYEVAWQGPCAGTPAFCQRYRVTAICTNGSVVLSTVDLSEYTAEISQFSSFRFLPVTGGTDQTGVLTITLRNSATGTAKDVVLQPSGQID